MTLRLPERNWATKTNDEDPIEYYYHPLTGMFYRRRLKMAARALGEGLFEHGLDIGYGSGIFLPTLSLHTSRISAIDVHTNVEPVKDMLAAEGLQADLWVGDVLHVSVRDREFDVVVCLSVLEHLDVAQLEDALSEIVRVSRPQAVIVLGFPCRNVLTDTFYRLVGYNPRAIHPSGHREILRAIIANDQLQVAKISKFFPFLPAWLNAYMVCKCVRV